MPEKSDNNVRRTLWSTTASLITAIIIQSFCLAFWAGSMNARMNFVERRQERMSNQIETVMGHLIAVEKAK